MKKQWPLLMAVILCGAYPAMAQRPEEHPSPQAQPQHTPASNAPHANNGRIPPPPPKRTAAPPPQQNKNQMREEKNHPESHPQNPPQNHNDDRQRRETRQENEKQPPRPHVENDQWYGHDTNDARYRVGHPYEHGHFEHFGQQYRYSVQRIDRDRHEFWFPGGFYFQIADWDWAVAADWCWNCGDNFVVYEDPDHPGWYLVYDTGTGEYVHAEYMGG